MGLGSGFGGALRATAPQAQFSMPTVANPITTPEGKVLGYGAQTGPTTRHIIPETKTGALDASTRKEIDLLSREKTGLDKEMSGVGWEAEEPLPEFKAKHDATRSRRAFVQKRLAELLPGAYGGSSAQSSKPVAVSGQGTKEDPARPETEEQFKSIPSGSIYRNPSDGKLYRKK